MALKKQKTDDSVSKNKALAIAGFADERHAENLVILDVKGMTSYCDYFVVCSASSSPQAQGIYDWVEKKCKENGIILNHWERDEGGSWILGDFFSVVLHVFTDEAREIYNLEHLWSEAKTLKLPKIVKVSKPKKKAKKS
jgi:ribosome-associated protein